VVLIPAIAVFCGLAWPLGSTGPGPSAVSADNSRITNPADVIGSGRGPAAPPSVKATGIDAVADPADPTPGTVATLTITVSGRQGSDRYGVSGATVKLQISDQPEHDAQLSATSVVTDAGGAASVRLTLSKTRGRHVVNITSAALSTQYVADTLGAGGQVSRIRHSGEIAGVPQVERGSPVPYFVAAVIILVLGFAAPYLIRLRFLRRPAPLARPTPRAAATRRRGLRPSR
jgi:hypothetical protein